MKLYKMIMLAFVALSLVGIATADVQRFGFEVAFSKQPIDIVTGNADYECTQAGFDFGIAKWEWDDAGTYVREGSDYPGYVTSVTGASQAQADWTSNPAAAGVLSKEAGNYFLLLGGTSGTIYQGDHGISHVTLCGNDGPDDEVPEFGVLAAFGVLALAGVFISRKRK